MRWHLARTVPVRNARGEIDCWFGTSTDIHDRIEIEQTLKDADVRKNQFLATLAQRAAQSAFTDQLRVAALAARRG